jgi:uncharacterized membrane protein
MCVFILPFMFHFAKQGRDIFLFLLIDFVYILE